MRLFFHQLGEGEPLILLHGLFGMSDNLMPIARDLADHFRVYVPDLPNHGRSPHVEKIDFDTMAAAVRVMMDEQGIRQSHILGHSLGGKVAMAFAKSYPARVKSVVVADIAPVSYPPYHEPVFKGLYAVSMAGVATRREADAKLAEHVDDESVRRFLLKSLLQSEQGQWGWRFNLDALAQNYHRLRESITLEPPFTGPSLFIKGQNSNYITRDHEAAIRQSFPEFQFKMIQNAGHWLHAEKPAAFTKLVRNFLEAQCQALSAHSQVEKAEQLLETA